MGKMEETKTGGKATQVPGCSVVLCSAEQCSEVQCGVMYCECNKPLVKSTCKHVFTPNINKNI